MTEPSSRPSDNLPPLNFEPEYATTSDLAAYYRDCGWQVVPAWMPGELKDGSSWKRPYLKRWTSYQNELVSLAVFRSFYDPIKGQYSQRQNLGLITGRVSRTMVVDLDTQKRPEALQWWRGLLEVHANGIEPETVEQVTGGGGIQLFFRIPVGVPIPTCKTSVGVDVRGEGGFAMLPGSRHESGRDYAWKVGRAPWECELVLAPDWLVAEVKKLAQSHAAATAGASGGNGHAAAGAYERTVFGKVRDGREEVMRDAVWRAVLEWQRECPIKPPDGEWLPRAREAYEAYETTVEVQDRTSTLSKREQLDAEGRGTQEWWRKWRAAMAQWDTDEFRAEAAKPPPGEDAPDEDFTAGVDAAAAEAKATPGGLYPYLDVPAIKASADPLWAIAGLIPQQGVGFFYGPPATLKTFLAMNVGLTVACALPDWWGYPIQRSGAVIYICSEGMGSFKFRLMAWEKHHGINADKAPFYLIKETINFMRKEDIGKLVATVQAIKDVIQQPIALVVVDTVSRVLPGAKENQQEDMTRFIGGCDAVRSKFECAVIGLHHTNKLGDIRGSTVLPGAGDFVVEVKRDRAEMKGSFVAAKIRDADDGWEQFFTVNEVKLGALGAQTSLVLVPVNKAQPPPTDWIPPRHTCDEILKAIDEQWQAGRPWCHAKNNPRWAVRNIAIRWRLDPKNVERLLEHWLAHNRIVHDVRDAKNHVHGYRLRGESE
jgi:AAA domain/Bifunctional DNA primase/polymerase, N-terminal